MIRLEGRGLRTAAVCAVRLERSDGPLRLRSGAHEATLDRIRVHDATRATTIDCGSFRVATVEHLFAALAAANAREGLTITFEGPEVPFLDGAARAFLDAIRALEVAPSPPRLRVARDAAVDGYRFRPGSEVTLEVAIDFADPRLAASARWDGTLESFRNDIAAARTFAMAHEVEGLAERGLLAHVAKESAVVIANDEILSAGAPFTADEPARHKLLDLAGDLFVWGGPPVGEVVASRPGHTATHAVMRRALESGIVEFTSV